MFSSLFTICCLILWVNVLCVNINNSLLSWHQSTSCSTSVRYGCCLSVDEALFCGIICEQSLCCLRCELVLLSEQQGHSHGVRGVASESNSLWSFVQKVQCSSSDGGSEDLSLDLYSNHQPSRMCSPCSGETELCVRVCIYYLGNSLSNVRTDTGQASFMMISRRDDGHSSTSQWTSSAQV